MVNLVHDALGRPSPARDHLLQRLRKGIRLARTTQPVQKGLPVPPSLLTDVLRRWGPNESLSLERLRSKLCALLAFLALLRPSDLILPTMGQVTVPPAHDRVIVCLLGFKNDYTAKGASVTVWRCSDPLLDPVSCFLCWKRRIMDMRGPEVATTPVIIQLRRPYRGISAATASGILNQFIAAAGGDRTLLSARGFRRGGASWAVAKEVMTDKILHLGRWASERVFHQHYAQAGVDSNFTDLMLSTGPGGRSHGPPSSAAAALAPCTDLVLRTPALAEPEPAAPVEHESASDASSERLPAKATHRRRPVSRRASAMFADPTSSSSCEPDAASSPSSASSTESPGSARRRFQA
ncbi:MAG TPA: hypothetical protein PKA36_11325, partial [Pseudoxanthomonas mexicana]|nr:hypothetical protein [Pseudoxanthomonas mexicana]